VDLPVIVRSAHTWDTSGPNDLRQDEEAIVVNADEEDGWSTWMLIPLDRPRLIRLTCRGGVRDVLRKWLKPA
jgi:hypothetical protein